MLMLRRCAPDWSSRVRIWDANPAQLLFNFNTEGSNPTPFTDTMSLCADSDLLDKVAIPQEHDGKVLPTSLALL